VTYLVFVFLQPIFETVVLDLGVSQSREIPPRMVLRNVQSLRCGTELLHWCDSGSSRASNVVSVAPLHRRRRADRDVFRSGARASDVPTDSGTFGRDAVVRRTVHQRPNRDDGARDRTQRDGDGEWSRRRSVSTRERDPSDVASPLFALAVAGGVLVVGATGCCFGRHRSSGDDRYPLNPRERTLATLV